MTGNAETCLRMPFEGDFGPKLPLILKFVTAHFTKAQVSSRKKAKKCHKLENGRHLHPENH
ncbi:hypothetical protein [Corynebacterium lactis]|uniref:hypothetical protein n=1 Tax=Corynebacterium lactis TaxID=1231000 RepID=UPI0012E2EB44|nr:hypothetical protein [Corynebacterium lactis]